MRQADAQVDVLRKSLKFGNLLFTFVRSYSAELLPHILSLRRTVEKLETFLRKSTLAAIERMEAPQTLQN